MDSHYRFLQISLTRFGTIMYPGYQKSHQLNSCNLYSGISNPYFRNGLYAPANVKILPPLRVP